MAEQAARGANERACLRVCVCVCARVCVLVCVCVCCVFVHDKGRSVHA